MTRQARMLAPDAFDALVVWPQEFSKFLFEEVTRLAMNDVTGRSISQGDVATALPAAIRRLQITIESQPKGPHFEIVRKAA